MEQYEEIKKNSQNEVIKKVIAQHQIHNCAECGRYDIGSLFGEKYYECYHSLLEEPTKCLKKLYESCDMIHIRQESHYEMLAFDVWHYEKKRCKRYCENPHWCKHCEKEDIMIKMDAIRRILSYYDMWR